ARGGRFFSLPARVLELGYAYLSSLTLPEVAEPHLERLVAEVNESSSVSVLDRDDVVYVARVPTSRIMTVAINVGTRFPAYATSMGRVLLAGLPDPELGTYLDRVELAALTPRTITSVPALRTERRGAADRAGAGPQPGRGDGEPGVGGGVAGGGRADPGPDRQRGGRRQRVRARQPGVAGGDAPRLAAAAADGRGADRGRPSGGGAAHRPALRCCGRPDVPDVPPA